MKKHAPVSPPRWVERILRQFLDEELLESVLGDIDEKFKVRVADGSVLRAKMLYVLEGFGLIRLSTYKKKKNAFTANSIDMCKNYILIAVRNLRREKIYSIMNVFGLAVGMATALVIYRYLQFEVSYDKFHVNHENLFRITEDFEDDAMRVKSAMSHAPVAELLSNNIVGLKNTIRIYPYTGFASIDKLTKYRESSFYFVDSVFFEAFSFEAIEGSLQHALDDPFSIVLTEKMANKYFGKVQCVGKELFLEDETQLFSFNVTAVIKDVPQNSHLSFDMVASFSSLEKFMPWYNNWHHPPMYIYLQTEKGTSFESMATAMVSYINQHAPDYVKDEDRVFHVQPITDIHLYSALESEWEANSDYRYVQIFALLALFVLLIACINFMNMATAQATKRSREIGVRKVFGGVRTQLVFQFLSETFVFVALSFLGACLLAELSLKFVLNEIISKNLSLLTLLTWPHWAIGLVLILFVALVAGLYPSIYLSRFKPNQIIKGNVGGIRNSTALRKGLVTFQLVVSCLLISCTVIVSSQTDYFRSKNLGFEKEHIITINLTDRFAQSNYSVLKEKLLAQSNVVDAGLSSALPGKGSFYGFNAKPEGLASDKEISIKSLGVDEGFISTYNINIISGRDFSKDIVTDQTDAFILNEAAAARFGWTDPVGKDFEFTVYINGAKKRKGKIIGLVSDFNFQSLHNNVEPLVLYINKHPYYSEYLSVRLKLGNIAASVNTIETTWKSFHPDKPVQYQFLSDDLNHLYKSEMKLGMIFTSIMIIAIAISCLGLFALSSFNSSKRAKEMSIRKVFGASIRNILSIQFKEYTAIILLANAIVIPVSLYWGHHWLNGFAYHVSITPLMFVITLLGSLIMALLIVSFHSLRLAYRNPIDTIRYE